MDEEATGDELLDFEALEALLENEDDEHLYLGNDPKEETKESVEDFYNAASDSDDDIKEATTLQNFTERESMEDAISPNHKQKNGRLNKGSSSGLSKSSHRTKQAKDQRSATVVSEAEDELSTEVLKSQMAKMQEQMNQLQKLLQMKSQVPVQEKKPVLPKVEKAISQPGSVRDRKDNVQFGSHSKKIFQEQIGKGSTSSEEKRQSTLKRIPNVDENPFFDAPAGKSIKNRKEIMEKSKTEPIKESSRKARERELFGDSDSDWEDLDGEDKKTLSEAGQDLKRIMNAGHSRVAHQAKFGAVKSGSCTSSQSWARFYSEIDSEADKSKKRKPEEPVKNALQCKVSSSDQANLKNETVKEEPSVTEGFSKIRIINPLISSSLMKMRMEGRQMISVPRIHLKMKTAEMQGDWVTIGVVVWKSDAKTSSAGKPYSIWRLNDLEDLDNSVSFFLFGEVHKQLWKTELGTVIGVLNPTLMDSMEGKSGGEPAFTIKNPSQMMVMGRSKDLAWCIGLSKAGNKCCKFINRRQGDFCAYHVQAAYRKTSASRLELHGSVTGVKPKSFEKRIFAKDAVYMYGGQTFVPNSRAESGKSKKGLTLSKLQQSMNEGRYNKVNTLSIQDIKPKVRTPAGHSGSKIEEEKCDTFLGMLSVPSPGSMQFVASMKKQNNGHSCDEAGGGRTGSKSFCSAAGGLGNSVQSVSAKDLIKMHKLEMDRKRSQAQKRPLPQEKDRERDPLLEMPQLGKGFGSQQDIVLDGGKRRIMAKADLSKLKAIAAVKQKGGLQKLDPNATKKSGEKVQEKIKERVGFDQDLLKVERASSSTSSPEEVRKRASPKEPPKKKSKLLGDVDLNSDEVKSILKAKSKHKGILAKAEAEREDAYFTELEKKEVLEEKMQSVTSIEITVVTCKMCMYTAQSAKDSCKKEGHPLKRRKAKKRFFMCKKCKQRTYVIDTKFPTEACRKCGATSYEKTSMCPVRSGPKLESEVLNLRGDEVKYLNSLDQKVYLNTVIDD